MFGDTVSTRVVPRYLDMLDMVSLLQVGERFDEHRHIVGDNLEECPIGTVCPRRSNC